MQPNGAFSMRNTGIAILATFLCMINVHGAAAQQMLPPVEYNHPAVTCGVSNDNGGILEWTAASPTVMNPIMCVPGFSGIVSSGAVTIALPVTINGTFSPQGGVTFLPNSSITLGSLDASCQNGGNLYVTGSPSNQQVKCCPYGTVMMTGGSCGLLN